MPQKRLLTEEALRDAIRLKGEVDSFEIDADTIVTPAARTFLADRRIRLVTRSCCETPASAPATETAACADADGPTFVLEGLGVTVREKPENYTHLRGNRLVPKTDARIRFRGKLDSLESTILIVQARLAAKNATALLRDLDELLAVVRTILRAEVLDVPLEPFALMGMTEERIREISHDPKGAFGIGHFMPDRSMGEDMAHLNLLRTEVRAAELAACDAFCGREPGRGDIIRSMNRLSSAVYVMMCRLKSGAFYGNGGR